MRSNKDKGGPRYGCNRCGHSWIGRTDKRPTFCPECRSKNWDAPRPRMLKCHVCGYGWECRSDSDPKRCPSCRSMKWNSLRYRLQCLRCGHKWVPRNNTSPNDIGICPQCKSRKWNRIPTVTKCTLCKSYFVNESTSCIPRCPACASAGDGVVQKCPFCNSRWISKKDTWDACPVCGSSYSNVCGDLIIDMWSDENTFLKYHANEGTGVVYLWIGGKPICSKYLAEVLQKTQKNVEQIMYTVGKPGFNEMWKGIVEWMFSERDRYLENMDYLRERLRLDCRDAEILSLHFTGMGPEAIGIRLDVPYEEVRSSFTRIMDIYVQNNIVVDDTIYTRDPFSEY